jgi:transposase-like protein
MTDKPDLIDYCLTELTTLIPVPADVIKRLDAALRQHMGGITTTYVRKRSPFLRVEIRARYDGTMATTRQLASEFGISETTVRRIGIRRQNTADRTPAPSPKLTAAPRQVAKKSPKSASFGDADHGNLS